MYTTIKARLPKTLATTRRLFLSVALACVANLSLVSHAAAQDYEKMTLTFGHPYNEAHPLALGAQRFADIVNERSGGNITVQVFPNSTIGSSRELVEAMRINVVDIALVPTTNVASFYPKLDVFYLPFVFRDRFHAYAVSDGEVGQSMFEDMRQQIGIRTLAMYESGFRTITTRDKKIEKPEDMEGVKFRVINNPLNVATFDALGANSTPMPLSEVFTGLQQGTVDGQDNPIGNVRAFGFDKVQGNITLSNHQWAGIMFLVNDGKFGGFSTDTQELLTSVAKETQDWEREEINRVEGELLAEMEADGMVVTHLTPEQSQAFQDRMSAVWEEYSDRLDADLIDAVVNAR
ncbi:MAG: TRAP transporter substrate-binding protein [Pseudomonadota bacterium]